MVAPERWLVVVVPHRPLEEMVQGNCTEVVVPDEYLVVVSDKYLEVVVPDECLEVVVSDKYLEIVSDK